MIPPVLLVNKELEKIRQTGRTYNLVRSLPTTECAIILYRLPHRGHIIDIIKRERPDIDLKNIRFLSYYTIELDETILKNLDIPVYVDNCVLDMIQLEYVRKLNNANS